MVLLQIVQKVVPYAMKKNLNLVLSGLIVLSAGFVYGGHPAYRMPLILDFQVGALELKNMLRAVMGIYMGIGVL